MFQNGQAVWLLVGSGTGLESSSNFNKELYMSMNRMSYVKRVQALRWLLKLDLATHCVLESYGQAIWPGQAFGAKIQQAQVSWRSRRNVSHIAIAEGPASKRPPYEGIGALSAGASSRLLQDQPRELVG
eukprot:s147_g2.t1